MSASKNKIFLCLPAFGRVNQAETTMSLMELAQALHANGYEYYFATQSYPDIGELRDMMLTLWYDRLADAEHCLMVDADMGFPAQLVLDMLALNEPLVGCLYPKKTYPISYVGRLQPNGERRPGFLEMRDIGFGVTLIRRDCVRDMLDSGIAESEARIDAFTYGPMLREWGVNRLIKAFNRVETVTGFMTEDYSFCQRHRWAGGKVWAATDHRITHVGPHGYSGRFADLSSPVFQYQNAFFVDPNQAAG
jgi:hypothetical protein